jgi:hypothetical protein
MVGAGKAVGDASSMGGVEVAGSGARLPGAMGLGIATAVACGSGAEVAVARGRGGTFPAEPLVWRVDMQPLRLIATTVRLTR